jgi:hypothetical protein
MTIAGFCRTCGQNVWCDSEGNCAQGHPKTEVSEWYDPETGQRFDFSAPAQPAAPEAAAAPAGSEKDVIVSEVYQALLGKTGYNMTAGTDTDLVINSEIANASWATGKKKVEYSAIMKVEESDRTIYWWEMLKESGGGLSFGTMGSESYSTVGAKRWGTTKEVVLGPDGVAVNYSWDYAATRNVAEEIAKRHGYKLKVVLRKKAAQR